jgi:hypothetical protein
VPLAGHEIGHSAWRRHKVERAIAIDLVEAVRHAIDANETRRDELLETAFGRRVRVDILQQQTLGWALRHVEEVFCDFVGFYIFGEAYLWAFEYFLAPGSGDRNRYYPSDAARVRYLEMAARQLHITCDPSLFASWRSASYPSGRIGDLLRITDEAVERVVSNLWLKTQELLTQLGIRRTDETSTKRVLDRFDKGVPDGAGASLPEVIAAGWRFVRAKRELLDTDDPNFDGLNELMLKTIEVSEYLLKVQTIC